MIIVGAGIAGLSACNRLTEYGFDVKILEANHYIGGRILTDYSTGIPIGLGASWIHGITNNPINRLANENHTDLVTVDPTKFTVFDRHGDPIPPDIIKQFDTKFNHLLEKSQQYSFQTKTDLSLSSALLHFVDIERFSPVEKDLFKIKLNYFEGYIGASYQLLSARHWNQEHAWPGANCFLTNSYQPIVDGLAKQCDILLNTRVTAIHSQKNTIQVITENTIFNADIVLITVPLGVLKKNAIQFSPALSVEKQHAIDNLAMGLFNITALKFPHAFWPNESQILFFTQFNNHSISTFFNLHHFIKEPIIIGYSGGECAKKIETLSDTELVKQTMDNFNDFFGKNIPEPESFITTRWSQNPFSYGSYSYIPVGASGDDYEALAKPESNRLFFAGEATSSIYPATTHGAYLSGIREAERINAIGN